MKSEKKSWMKSLFAYAEGQQKTTILSVILSVISVSIGLVPFYCMYEIICLFTADTVTSAEIVKWCMIALAAYVVKILTFSLSSGTSHSMAYTVLEGLRLRLANRFLHAPLGNVENHTTGSRLVTDWLSVMHSKEFRSDISGRSAQVTFSAR